ncbi:MAG: hypothetical protein KDB27_02355 [Planctomycetales bacterium]|nr:hypothetical protein [Planctomycetales bacterium]
MRCHDILEACHAWIDNEFRFLSRRNARVILLVCCVAQFCQGADSTEAKLVGHEACGECHQAELTTWQTSPHAIKPNAMIDQRSRSFNPKAKKILDTLSLNDAGHSVENCAKCHDTRQSQNSHVLSLNGVSCESCHGAAGNQGLDEGWLDLHSDPASVECGPVDSEHDAVIQRVSYLEQRGMRHPKNVYGIMKACFECHTVADEEVVNAGHPVGSIGFEYLSWFGRDLQHPSELTARDPNEARDKNMACVKFIVGQLVDLEVSLHNRSKSKTREFATSSATRIASAHQVLTRIQELEPLPEIESALNEVDSVYPKLFSADPTNRLAFVTASVSVSQIAEKFSMKYENADLCKLESLLPNSMPYLLDSGPPSNSANATFVAQSHEGEKHPDPAKVAGHKVCVRCHQAEYDTWMRSAHGQEAFDELRTNPNSFLYAQRLGIAPGDLATRSVCITCHATPQVDRHGQPNVLAGVSCESCHNAAGGQSGWLNIHSVYGPAGARRKHESSEYRSRRTHRLQQAGMNRTNDVYELAKACYQCHVVSNERVVSHGGHKVGRFDFEWVEWLQRGVRHNFHLNQNHNSEAPTLWMHDHLGDGTKPKNASDRKRLMFVVGQLVDIEISLRNRANATSHEFARAAAGRVLAAIARLKELQDSLVSTLITEVLDKIDSISSLLFSRPDHDSAAQLASLADRVGVLGKQLRLSAAPDTLVRNTDVPATNSSVDKVYQP